MEWNSLSTQITCCPCSYIHLWLYPKPFPYGLWAGTWGSTGGSGTQLGAMPHSAPPLWIQPEGFSHQPSFLPNRSTMGWGKWVSTQNQTPSKQKKSHNLHECPWYWTEKKTAALNQVKNLHVFFWTCLLVLRPQTGWTNIRLTSLSQ